MHEDAAEGLALYQMAHSLRRPGHRKHLADGRLQRAFRQIAYERVLRRGERLWREQTEGEAANRRRLPDDVRHIDLGFSPAGISDDRERAAGRERGEGLAGEP